MISEIAEQVSYYYIFLGRVRLYWVPTVPCSVFITIRNHRNHHRRMQIQNLFDDRLLILSFALVSTSFVDHYFVLAMKSPERLFQ